MHKPGGSQVRNQRQTPAATNGYNTQTTQTVGQAQFAIAEPAGIELMGHTMQALMGPRRDLAWLQLDCTNAFGELSREKYLQALHNKVPHLLAFDAQRLTQPTRAISRNEKGDTMEFMITAGLDQGDPFSPVAFAEYRWEGYTAQSSKRNETQE